MAGENITIDFGQAMANAEEIEKIINNIESAMDILNKGFKRTADDTELKWFNEMVDQWNTYSQGKVPETLEEMRKSKTNIEATVAAMQQYQQ